MKRLIAALGARWGVCCPAWPAPPTSSRRSATFDGQFLKIAVGARAAPAWAAPFVGVADDAAAVFWNAAGIARIDPDKSRAVVQPRELAGGPVASTRSATCST